MGRNSEQRCATTLLGLCKAWQSYVGWWEILERQVAESADVRRDAEHATVERIANAFSALVENEKTRLADLLKISDRQLYPLSDPFRLPLLRHRWLDLRREREESYSDWLAWLLERMDSAERVLRVFGLEQTDFGEVVRREEPRVYREKEFRAPSGELKRLDIVVTFGDAGILLVEVKIRELELAGGIENLPIYRRWLEERQPDPRRGYAVLLVPNSMESPSPGWEVRPWDQASLSLRLQAREYAAKRKQSAPSEESGIQASSTQDTPLVAAMLLCFAGAVEQNILGLDGTGHPISAPQTALYLERFLQGRQ
jgi:hypothetical protein